MRDLFCLFYFHVIFKRKRGETSRALLYILSCLFYTADSYKMFVSKIRRSMYCHQHVSLTAFFFIYTLPS